jgi:hypothetical protein
MKNKQYLETEKELESHDVKKELTSGHFYNKKHTPNIIWTRVESWASFGFPDLVGYTEKQGFFTLELKVTKSNKVTFSPHQIAFHIKHPKHTFILVATHAQSCPKLYPGAAVQDLVACGLPLEAWCLELETWDQLESLLLAA